MQRPGTPPTPEKKKQELAEKLKQYWKLTCTTIHAYTDDMAILIWENLVLALDSDADQSKLDFVEQPLKDKGIEEFRIKHTENEYVYMFLVYLAIKWEVGYDEILKDVYKNSKSEEVLLKKA
jgi:hypothetical protein